MASTESIPRYSLCVINEGYPASLERRKVYQASPDPVAGERGFVRVVDESGEDFRYPSRYFVAIEPPRDAVNAFVGSP